MSFKQFLQGVLTVVINDYRQVRSEWYFAKKQMDTLEKTRSLYKQEDDINGF